MIINFQEMVWLILWTVSVTIQDGTVWLCDYMDQFFIQELQQWAAAAAGPWVWNSVG